jgi:TolA-binding protein
MAQDPLSSQTAEKGYSHALDLIAHRAYGPAYRILTDYLTFPDRAVSRQADARYYQALCAVHLYHTDGERMMETYIDQYPLSPKAMAANFELATFFYYEKNYSRSAGYFGKVDFQSLSRDQQNTGHFRWGYSLFTLRKFKEALDQFNAIKGLGGQYGPAASYYAGFIESSQGDYANALIDLQRAETNPSYATIVPVLITYVYYKQKAYDQLLVYTAGVLSRENISSSAEISLLAAETYYRKNDFAHALPLYIDYLDDEARKADRGVLFRAGSTAFRQKDTDHALQYLKGSAAELDSIGTNSSYLIGVIYLQRKEKPLALTAFENVKNSTLDARIAEESLFLSAKINYDLGRADESIGEFEGLLKRYPQSLHQQETRELLSQAYINANNFNKAIEYIESLPRRSPAVDRAYQKATYLKGTDFFNKEDYVNAVQYLQKSLEVPIDPSLESEAAYWLGESFSIGKKHEQAVGFYEHALGAAPSASLRNDIRYGLGYARYNLQQYDQAMTSFKEFVLKADSHDPRFADASIRLGDCYYTRKSNGDALASYRKAIQAGTLDADYVHLQQGIILTMEGRYNDAASELDIVAATKGSRYTEEALFKRGQLDFEQSNYAGAVSRFTTLINTAKSSRWVPFAFTRRAAANYNLRKYDATANDYIEVLEKYPTHPAAQDLLLPLQEALTLAKRSGEFDKYLAQFKAINPDAAGIEIVEFEAAKNLYFNQSYATAIDKLGTYAQNYPESPRRTEARYYQAESYYRLKDYAKALELYNDIADETTFAFINKTVGRQAELTFKLGNYEKAVASFQRLQVIAANKKEQNTAWNGLMESYYLLAMYDSTDTYARKLLNQSNVNVGSQNKASLYLGKSAMAKGDYESAKDEFINTINAAHDEYGAEAKYLLGEIFYLTKEHKQCYETLLGVKSEFSTYTEWVGKAFLLLADNYVATNEIFQAKGTLKSLVDNFPTQEVKDLAREKLKKIEQEELLNKAKADSTDRDK